MASPFLFCVGRFGAQLTVDVVHLVEKVFGLVVVKECHRSGVTLGKFGERRVIVSRSAFGLGKGEAALPDGYIIGVRVFPFRGLEK